ncbi:MAG TPA: phosphatase PAP2 family protein [Rariglobus sp.]|nr:phosphatase PAP2 family protein [Rariglobus sp.]
MKTVRPPFTIDRTWWLALIALAAVLAVFEATRLDLWVQDHFYDFQAHAWLVDDEGFWGRVFFYKGPKILIIIFAIGLLVLALGRTRWRKRLSRPPVRRRDLFVVVAVLATAPALIALGKATTNVFFPSQIRRYGGFAPYVRTFEAYPQNDRPAKPGRGFPAGHASGGFALLSLAGLARTRRGRWLGLLMGLSVGTLMGGYQMLKGAHYLSHTLVTALVCWLVFLGWRRVLGANDDFAAMLETDPMKNRSIQSPAIHSQS